MTGFAATIGVYREKTVIVTAVRFETNNDDGSHVATVVGWGNDVAPKHQHLWTDNTRIYLEDLDEGRSVLEVGDWLIRHHDGRLSAMAHQLFEIDYELVPAPEEGAA